MRKKQGQLERKKLDLEQGAGTGTEEEEQEREFDITLLVVQLEKVKQSLDRLLLGRGVYAIINDASVNKITVEQAAFRIYQIVKDLEDAIPQ